MRLVMLAAPGESTNIIYNALRQTFAIEAVVLEEPVSRLLLIRNRLRRLGALRVAGQLLFQIVFTPLLKWRARKRLTAIRAQHGLDAAPIPAAQIVAVSSVNAPETIALLRRMQPDVIVVNGTRIITPDVLTAVSAVFLNVHAGITPLYRGVHGAYWAIASGDRANAGVTVHVVDRGIDTGGVVAQRAIEPTSADSFVTYPLLQTAAGLELLRDAVRDAAEGKLKCVSPPPGESKLWTHPTAGQYVANRVRRGVR